MDALGEILRGLRLDSGLISHAHLTTPWSVHTEGTPFAIFHAVTHGEAWLKVDGLDAVHLGPEDLILLPAGDPHVLSDRPGRPSRHVAKLPMLRDGTCVAKLVHGGGGRPTQILCGSFVLRRSSAHSSLLKLLPRVVKIGAGEARLVRWLAANVELLGPELDVSRPGAEAIVARVTDALFVQLLRAYAARQDIAARGWMGALRDRRIAQALALIHAEPAEPWTAGSLARRVGMSRTAFHERFREVVADTPAAYVSTWRMHVACDLLDEAPLLSTAEIAEKVGYRSDDAFCKTFRRRIGRSPSAWRRRQQAS